MRNYEIEKFINTYVRTTNEKGKVVKLKFKKDAASKAELDAVLAKIDGKFVDAWAQYVKLLAKQFKAQTEVTEYREFVAASKKPGKKLVAELGLPTEMLMV